jgi:predicted amidohydrolase
MENMEKFILQSKNRNSDLIVFPEYNFFDIFGFIPVMKPLNFLLKFFHSENVQKPDSADQNTLMHDIFFMLAQGIEESMKILYSQLARKYGIFIYSGTFIIKRSNSLYNCGFLFDRAGKVVLEQMKTHLTPSEEKMGITCGNTLETFLINGVRFAFPICMDASYFEVFRILMDMNTDVAVIPIANNEEYDISRAARGIWARVQETPMYGIKSSLNGWIMGQKFTGKAGIFAPVNLTASQNGVVAISSAPSGDFLITSLIDPSSIRLYSKNNEYSVHHNFDFEFQSCNSYKKYNPHDIKKKGPA